MNKFIILLALTLSACTRGPHVGIIHVEVTKYGCYYSDDVFHADRRVAICDTEEQCNDICQKLR